MLAAARALLDSEARALARASARLDGRFERAVELVLACGGKVITSGIGKSGFVARKLAATLCATGTPAAYLHPAEAMHGDLGLVAPGDVIILISKSGATEELVRLLPKLQELGATLVGIFGNVDGPLARGCDAVLDASVDGEGDPHNLVPAASVLVATALGDALAAALMHAREFGPEQFGVLHPGGQLGRNLRLRVADVMHAGDQVPWVRPGDALRAVVIAMTAKPLGAACVLHEDGSLAGLITDGDLRRALERHEDIRGLCAAAVMTERPVTVLPDVLLRDALALLETRTRQLSVPPVVDRQGRATGLLRLHDIYVGRV